MFLVLIERYKKSISPFLAPACRYQPTCSQYAHDAIERHGALRGLILAAYRLVRCTPLGRGGFDPVR